MFQHSMKSYAPHAIWIEVTDSQQILVDNRPRIRRSTIMLNTIRTPEHTVALLQALRAVEPHNGKARNVAIIQA